MTQGGDKYEGLVEVSSSPPVNRARRTGVGPYKVILTADRPTADRTKVLCGGPGYCAACDGGQ